MDVWVVAAAAGAGYVAQRLKNLAKSNLSSESSNIRQKAGDKSCPSGRVLSRKKIGEEMCRERENACDNASSAEMGSTSVLEGENLAMLDNFASCSSVSNSNSLDGFSKYEDVQGDLGGGRVPSDIDEVIITSDSLLQPSSREMGYPYGFRRNRSSLRSRRINTRLIKPRTSLESCLMAQLYKEHAEIEEYTYSLRPLQEPTLRPFLVTDGSRIISRAPRESFSEQTGTAKVKLGKDTFSQENNPVIGVPGLPNVVHTKLQKKAKGRKGKGKEQDLRRIDSGKMANGNRNNAQGGTSDRDLLFYHGLTMGIIASFMANKREMEKLNKMLKQTENLVQDLQDELEMKDSLTVKELAIENYELRDVHNDCYINDAVHALSLEQKLDDPSRYCNEEYSDQKAGEESLSKIEAELEAELERLESNMNSSRLKSKTSNVAELDPDLISDVIKGELRADLFGAKTCNQPYADRDGSGTSTPRSAHYPVSPRELSLRLHEVIQSRLEERVKELETALHNTQRKLKYIQSSSTPDSPLAKNGPQPADPPIVINLSGEALAAYNEAYEEFTKVSESDEEDLAFGFENGDINRYIEEHLDSNGSREMVFDQRIEEDQYTMSNGVLSGSNDESEDGEDEMEKLLIKQIIEKAKQGSPAVLKAQRALLSTDECEH
ncbi:hypothetical protein BUALT_Bualt02G0158500 [Buddleja alternifolia]|uniref:Uncharacterized protein n=1 Tax=Buddleja alternifolia TaxID=168488 RepID=A0AAV6Y974_9LAMI|nr:hypothetical protein BUALT_Bualt02G0158500 [Buddleja alternifolia]